MKNVFSLLLGVAMIVAGVFVILIWATETVAYVGGAALIAAGIAMIIAGWMRRTRMSRRL